MLRQIYFAAVTVLLCFGCAPLTTVNHHADSSLPLPMAKMADETIVLEVAFAQVPRNSDWNESVWSELDEQHLHPDLRRNLASNGFRAGIVGLQLPNGLREQLDVRPGPRGVLADLRPGEEQTAGARRIQMREGKRSDIVTRSSQKSLVVLIDDGENLVGRTFKDAQPTFVLRAHPLGDGRAQLEMVPEMRFGPNRQRWASGEGVFRMESGQDRQTFERLKIDSVLSPGQTLVVAASGPAKSLGGNFFAKDVDGQREKALLIRLSETSYADLYEDLDDVILTTDLD